MYQVNITSPKVTAAVGTRNVPSRVSEGQLRSGPRSTLQSASVRAGAALRPATGAALRCLRYQSCAQNGCSCHRCTWFRSEEHTSELHHLGISYAVFCL